mgnify:CR=1 FL=1
MITQISFSYQASRHGECQGDPKAKRTQRKTRKQQLNHEMKEINGMHEYRLGSKQDDTKLAVSGAPPPQQNPTVLEPLLAGWVSPVPGDCWW